MKPKEVDCLFLDLDGTVRHGYDQLIPNRFVNEIEDVIIFDGVKDLLMKYKELGYRIFIITNQGGIDARMVTREKVIANLNRTKELLTIDETLLIDNLYYCPHWFKLGGKLYCFCRKPQIGMLVHASDYLRKLNNEVLSFERSFVVGDREEDAKLAINANLSFLDAETWRRTDPNEVQELTLSPFASE